MFLLESLFGHLLLTSLISALTAVLLLALAYLILRANGRVFIRVKRPRIKGNAKKETLAPASEEELPEEVLLAILTAAVHACEETEKKRFRVVSFHRTR